MAVELRRIPNPNPVASQQAFTPQLQYGRDAMALAALDEDAQRIASSSGSVQPARAAGRRELEQRQPRAAGGNAGAAAAAEGRPRGDPSAMPQDWHAELQGAARGEAGRVEPQPQRSSEQSSYCWARRARCTVLPALEDCSSLIGRTQPAPTACSGWWNEQVEGAPCR